MGKPDSWWYYWGWLYEHHLWWVYGLYEEYARRFAILPSIWRLFIKFQWRIEIVRVYEDLFWILMGHMRNIYIMWPIPFLKFRGWLMSHMPSLNLTPLSFGRGDIWVFVQKAQCSLVETLKLMISYTFLLIRSY